MLNNSKDLTDGERSPTESAYSKNVLRNTIAFLTMALQETIIKKPSLVLLIKLIIFTVYFTSERWLFSFAPTRTRINSDTIPFNNCLNSRIVLITTKTMSNFGKPS